MTNIFEKSYRFEKTDRNTFLKFPHALFHDPQYAKIHNDAKLLYALMLDRTSLSELNSWYDKKGRLFIYFTIKEIELTLHCSHNKALRMLDELEGVHLIQRVHQGQGRPTRILVKKLALRDRFDFLKVGI